MIAWIEALLADPGQLWWTIPAAAGVGCVWLIRTDLRRRAKARSSADSPGLREQPRPVENGLPAVWDLVMRDMEARDRFGAAKYKTRLQPHNGRDALSDAYQEALDLCVYLRCVLFERDGK